MRFFVYEYFSACADTCLSDSMRLEGWGILRALAEDLARVPGAEVRALLGLDCSGAPFGCVAEHVPPHEEESTFRRLARWADFTLVIAPEFDDLLHSRCCWVEQENRRLLGPSSQAVALTSDKLALARHLRARGVQTPACAALPGSLLPFPLVLKPRFGAGSQATFRVRDQAELTACLETVHNEGWNGQMLLQPFVSGCAASVSFLIGPEQLLALAPAAQHLSADGRFRYRGGTIPLAPELAERAVRVARPAVAAVKGLFGYVGVDVVLGASDWVIEINARLTTSYLGLRAAAGANLAEMMVCIACGEKTGPPDWRPGLIRFSPFQVSRS